MSESYRGKGMPLPATIPCLDLSSFPLGSPASRAAARRVLEVRRATEPEEILMELSFINRPPLPGTTCTCPRPPTGTFATCECLIGPEDPRLSGRG
jgi:hypothetical protein